MAACIASSVSLRVPSTSKISQRRTAKPTYRRVVSTTLARREATSTSEVARVGSKVMGSAAAAIVAGAILLAPASMAKDNALVGEFTASGLVFKDSVEVIAFPDPKVEGVTLYISDFKRSLSAKLQKDFFSEPSQASLTCTQTGPLVPSVDLATLKGEGEEVYKERKNLSLSNKTLRVRRLYDQPNNTLVYVAYSTRLSGTPDGDNLSAGQYKTSICTVPMYQAVQVVEVAAPAPADAPPVSDFILP